MIILHVIVGLRVGGAELMLRRLVLAHQGSAEFVHHVVSLTDLGKIGAELRANRISVTCLEMKSPLDILRVMVRLVKLMRALRPTVVQTWMYHSDLLGGIAASLAGVRKIIWNIRTTNISSTGAIGTRIVRRICAVTSSWIPDTILSVAEAARTKHVALGYANDRMQVIPNGFDTAHFVADAAARERLRAVFSYAPSDMVVGSVGRYHAVKDHRNFIRAAGIVLRTRSHIKFCLVGRDCDASNAALVHEVALTGFAGNFLLLGERDDVAACLNAFDIFCLHSLNEGFPNSLGEAMATGLPCVSTDVGDAQALLGPTLRAVERGNPIALAESLEAMLTLDDDARAAHGDRGRARICESYSLAKICEQYECLYRNANV